MCGQAVVFKRSRQSEIRDAPHTRGKTPGHVSICGDPRKEEGEELIFFFIEICDVVSL
jgi:hypothetical protein